MAIYENQVAEKILRILQNSGRLDAAILDEARAQVNGRAGDTLVALIRAQMADEDLIHIILSRSFAIRHTMIEARQVDIRALLLIPAAFVDENYVIAYEVEGPLLKIAIVDPTMAAHVGQITALSNFTIEFQLITLTNFESLRRHERLRSALDDALKKQQAQTAMQIHKNRRVRFALDDKDLVPEFCTHILETAISARASDIHIEPFRDIARVRFRIDGRLVIQADYSEYVYAHFLAVVTRLKILADCDISEKRLPQDGALTMRYGTDDIDFRFNVLPGKYGERIVMRILKSDPSLSLDRIGLTPRNYAAVIDAITAPQGMVLVTGPTGSGKTTMLYGCLQHINNPQTNILTVEDPVEYYLEGVAQTQTNERIGLTFNTILRAFLRQDPEVILVGEIRDQQTVETAVTAALTGHLLLSTLHTNDAIATITRLSNMGVPPFMIAAATSLIIAQRLGQPNCQNCLGDDAQVTVPDLIKIGFTAEIAPTVSPKIGAGCPECEGTGYIGRCGVYEVLPITPQLEEAILREALAPELLAAAREDGFETMQDIARGFIQKGVFSYAEYCRILVL